MLEPAYLKMLVSEDNEVKAAACSALVALAKNLSEEENITKLYPILVKLSESKVDFVKSQFANNFVKVFLYFSP